MIGVILIFDELYLLTPTSVHENHLSGQLHLYIALGGTIFSTLDNEIVEPHPGST